MRSATTEQKPDIVMHIHKHERDITLTYLYDAKYRVRGDGDEQVSTVVDEPVAETLDAMHHYRDAIYYGKKGEPRFSKEIIGGYILFPGRMDEHKMLEDIRNKSNEIPYYLRSIDEVNIGAYPLLPNDDSGVLLENHLRRVLLDESIIEQLQDSVPQRGLYYTDTKPKSIESRNVFTVYLRLSDVDYEAFLNHTAKKYAIEKPPTVNILEARYLMPMVVGKIDGYYEIKGLAIEGGKMVFKLGNFLALGERWSKNISQNMRHGELITMENVHKLYAMQ